MVVLATKIYVSGDARQRALDSLSSLVGNQIGDLDVEWDVGVRHDGFPSVTLTGDDQVVARNALAEEWGAITAEFEPGEPYVGTLESWSEDGVVLDAGEEITIPTDELGLGPGDAGQIRQRFGLVQHLPLRFTYGEPSSLATTEQDRLYEWTRESAGRVNVNSSTRAHVRATLNRAGHANDIVTVERLGLLEQSIVCAEGTDPPGLVASIGAYLPAELLAVVP